MNFQSVVDSFEAMCCVVSVEKLPGGGCGRIRLVTGNQAYIDSIEKPAGGVQMLSQKFVPGSEYTDYLTRDMNFEDYCYRSAVEKKCLHSYAHPNRFDVWFNMTFLPLGPDEGDICYCLYVMEINFEPSSERLSNVSGELASAVLETTIALRGTRDFDETMKDVVREIREICGGEHISILLMDQEQRTCSILCEDFDEDTHLRSSDESGDEGFYEVAASWEDTISGSNCIIVKNAHDMEIVRERNPRWYQSLSKVGIRSVALFPLKRETELLGYMWISNFDPEQSTRIKETLELTSFILGVEIYNRLLLDRLRILSSQDMLTGVLNRNEMNNYVDRLSRDSSSSDRSIGVLFADLNGLKTVNDTEGHDAGDRMLRDAADVLCQVCPDGRIFRAGGDEFAVMLTDTSPEALRRKTEEIREISRRYEYVNFAIGSCFEKSCNNVRRALMAADQEMYEDKKKYYDRIKQARREQ